MWMAWQVRWIEDRAIDGVVRSYLLPQRCFIPFTYG